MEAPGSWQRSKAQEQASLAAACLPASQGFTMLAHPTQGRCSTQQGFCRVKTSRGKASSPPVHLREEPDGAEEVVGGDELGATGPVVQAVHVGQGHDAAGTLHGPH